MGKMNVSSNAKMMQPQPRMGVGMVISVSYVAERVKLSN
jgi:hypothetical protein